MGNAAKGVVYGVKAVHPTEASAAAYERWLLGGHVQAVMARGALRARVLRLQDGDGGQVALMVEYEFADVEAFDRYVKECAPALRAEGLALFGPSSGVVFSRWVGEVCGSL